MNNAHKKTLKLIFSNPVPAALEWHKIEALFATLGAQIVEGNGSRAAFVINNHRADFQSSHPGKEAKRYQVSMARDFLTSIGVSP